MKTKTILWLSSLLIVVNVVLGVTIYFLIKPEAKTAVVDNLLAIEVPSIELPQWKLPEVEIPEFELPEVELPKIEVTEEDVDAVKDSVKQKLLERAQLTGDGDDEFEGEPAHEDDNNNRYVVDHWGMTFHLPANKQLYNMSLRKDVLTIERNLQVMVYIARYDAGVRPAINGEWELLATFDESDFYVRKGSNVTYSSIGTNNPDGNELEQMRSDVYDTILKTYHFEQE